MSKLQGSILAHMNEHTEENTTGLTRCDACGAENPSGHKFCGSCGGPLAESEPASPGIAGAQVENRGTPRQYSEGENSPPPKDLYDLSLFRSFSAGDQEPRSHYRIYIGLFLALCLAGLGYKAWRSMQTTPRGLEEAPPPAATQQKAAPPAAAATTAPKAEKSASPVQNGSAQETPSVPQSTPTSAKPEPKAPGTNTPSAQPADNGAQELAIARHFLQGTNGQVRDGTEAAKWLWKSVAKQNSSATLLLADLYLKGEGVPKSCDQARLLLDSAARKNVPGAGERLRNLPAFGCQ